MPLFACEEFSKLADVLEANPNKLPEDFLNHVRACDECAFWTPWTLAVGEAFNTIDRFSYRTCPPTERFMDLIKSSLIFMRVNNTDKIDKTMVVAYGIDLIEFLALQIHIMQTSPCFCDLCNSYYNELFQKVEEKQKFFDAAIKNGQQIKLSKNQAKKRIVTFRENENMKPV